MTPDKVGNLQNFSRIKLAALPTPIQELHVLRRKLGSNAPRILIKRDDLTGIALGGNKARKLEYLLADARDKGADTLITCGAAQSNHALQTAAVAGKCGFNVICVLDGPSPLDADAPLGNLLLHRLIGTELRWCTLQGRETRNEQARRRTLTEVATEVSAAGGKPYVIPTGGSTAVGSLGYVQAVGEIVDQLKTMAEPRISAVFFASGSGGTHSGLVAGAQLFEWRTRLVGVDVDYIAADSQGVRPFLRATVNLSNETARLVGLSNTITNTEVELCSDYAGPRYGASTPECEEAIHLLASSEGIFLDPVYTGKAFAALIGAIRSDEYSAADTIMFWHTGGAAGLFAPH